MSTSQKAALSEYHALCIVKLLITTIAVVPPEEWDERRAGILRQWEWLNSEVKRCFWRRIAPHVFRSHCLAHGAYAFFLMAMDPKKGIAVMTRTAVRGAMFGLDGCSRDHLVRQCEITCSMTHAEASERVDWLIARFDLSKK